MGLTMAVLDRASAIIKETIDDLVNRQFSKLERDGRIGRLTPSQLEEAIARYGRTLVEFPIESLQNSHVYPIESMQNNSWNVEVELWTVEEGLSDLTLSFTLTEIDPEIFSLEIYDLHVL